MATVGERRAEPYSVVWIALVVGALSLAAGIIVLARPGHSLAALAVITGIFVWLDGMAEILRAILGAGGGQPGLTAAIGVVDLILGALLIRHPIAGVFAIALLLGLWLMAAGLLRLFAALAAEQHRLRRIASALVLAVAGAVIVASPHIRYTALAVVTGLGLIGYGAASLLVGFGLRAIHDRRPEAPA